MARRPTDRERKEQLIATLAASRESLRVDRQRIKSRLNPVVRVRSAVRDKPLPVFATAAGAAFLLTLLVRRRKRAPRPFRTRRMLAGWILSLAKPVARIWLADWARERFLPISTPIPPPDPAHTP